MEVSVVCYVSRRYVMTKSDRPKYEARITSYNVCYTKLLRAESPGPGVERGGVD